MDHRDPEPGRVTRLADIHFFALHQDLTGVGSQRAGEDLDQR
jgi:hypothetical protein